MTTSFVQMIPFLSAGIIATHY